MAVVLNGDSIPLALVGLGISHNAAPDMSSYAKLAETWRSSTEVEANGDTYAAIPTEAALQAEADSYETDDTSAYAATVRMERLRLIENCTNFLATHERQSNFEGIPDATRVTDPDGISDAERDTVMTYIKALADLPANIVAGPAGTYGTFAVPIYPTKPTRIPD